MLPSGLFPTYLMQSATESQTALSIERKLKMHEARESIIDRLAANLPTSINLDTFLTVIVSELGRMMEVDRCDIIKLNPDGELSISHEWRASNDVPSTCPAGAATLFCCAAGWVTPALVYPSYRALWRTLASRPSTGQ